MAEISKDWVLDFAPETGGSLKSCLYKGREILRTAISPNDPRETSAFPMVPFIGRITEGKFAFDGQNIELAENMPPEPHAIHGRGWQTPWDAMSGQQGEICLVHTYEGHDDWPWAYDAKQRFLALGNTLTLIMALTNQSKTPMPAGLGWHPYFPKSGAQLKADVSAAWGSPEGDIIGDRPCSLTQVTDLRSARAVDTLNLDHCYTVASGETVIEWPERGISLNIASGPGLDFLTVYVPTGEDYFCVEPVSHIPDAVNSKLSSAETGFCVLQPGETLEGQISLSVTLDRS